MNADKLKKWAELLLDTGKRNNLINFRTTRMSTVEVVFPDYVTLFQRADQSAVFEVFDPKLEVDDYEALTADTDSDEDESAPKTLSKEDFLSTYRDKMKKQQILTYNAANKPIAALKNISKKAKTELEERGVNIAYMTFGFINWTESDNAKIVMHAPILLTPIIIEQKSSIDPIKVRAIEDEMIVNPTFAFKMQSDYGIKLPEYADEGIENYLQSVEQLVAKLKWTVTTECEIGIFSFLKINMYKDLTDNGDKIVKNKNIRALLGDAEVRSGISEEYKDHGYDLLDLHNVVDADSSQADAIEMAKIGKDFVLQGPPGTGKSQTITNIIAECLSDGKKVLFVSEKLAALNVVYEKLKRVGLEEFCLELHSHKANKKAVIDELCRTLKLQKKSISDRAEKELRQKKEAQQKLDEYAVQLHKQQPVIKKSLYQLYVEVSACRNAPDVNFAINNIRLKGDEYIEKAENALTRYTNYVSSIGCDYHNNPWYGYKNPDCSYQAKMQLREDLPSISSLCRDLQQNAYTVLTNYAIKADSLDSARIYNKFFALAKFSEIITPQLLSLNTVKQVIEVLNAMQALTNEMNAYKATLKVVFDNDVYQLNGEQLHKKLTRQFNSGLSRIFNSEYKKIIADIRLCKKDDKAIKYKAAVKSLDTLRNYQLRVKSFGELESAIIDYLGSGYRGINTDFAACINELNYLTNLLACNVDLGRLTTMTREEFQCEKAFFASIAFRYEQSFDNSSNALKRLESSFDATAFNLNNVPLQSLIDKCTICQQNIDNLDNWCEFVKLINALTELELREFIDHCISEQVTAEYLVACYKKTFYMQWVDAVLHVSPVLMELARVPHDDTVSRFREKDKLHFEINKAKIKADLSAQRPNLNMITQGSSIAILMREGEKKRKQKVIRTLLYELGELTQTLKPCFLMSPLSVSTYLNSDMKFDVVVFDEASQIFPQDAVGAIYRAKQLIVVGDSKQMPPSNFFNAVTDIDNDDEDEDIKDFESILDMCSTTLPQRRLKWHYRSRCERLIAFSNKNFYDNDLITFPSSKKDVNGVGVDYIYVNGTFDRKSKTNQAEAEKIVDMVFENIKVYPSRSLGVVAFSVAQQSLIDHLISKRRQQNPIFEEFFKSDRFEPFFVKNLETVQGDERDTIIFSIAYAKDSQGRLLMNFGPINREGGERRLNVAVTRAKLNVQLVSSMHCYDIDLTRTQSHGARLLREYLDYAENGTIALDRALDVNIYEQFDSEFEMEVCEFLQNKGYVVDTQVGCSSFKIDLALKLPNSSDYVLAIECDGATYHSSKTARDRDRLRQDILENMGWKFYRIWSTDWFRNKNVEKDRLLTAVKDALLKHKMSKESPITFSSDTAQQPITFENIVVDKPFTFPPYIMADEVAIGKKLHHDIPRVVLEIMKIEIAISQEWLLKRICYMFGREKVTSAVTRDFNSLMSKLNKLGIVRRNGIILLQGAEMPTLRVPHGNAIPREIKYIPIAELASGIRELLKLNLTANKTGLFKSLAKELGFTRMGDVITECMENALKSLSAEIEVNGEMISLRN